MRRSRLLVLLAAAIVGLAALLAGHAAGPSPHVAARVDRVTDGDTLWLSGIGKVRLIGIDTPEVYGQAECYGPEASRFVKRLLPPGGRVDYQLGPEERDRYGRALAYVWLHDGRFLNRMLVEQGYARALTIPPNVDYAAVLAGAAQRAQRARRGLWGRAGCGS